MVTGTHSSTYLLVGSLCVHVHVASTVTTNQLGIIDCCAAAERLDTSAVGRAGLCTVFAPNVLSFAPAAASVWVHTCVQSLSFCWLLALSPPHLFGSELASVCVCAGPPSVVVLVVAHLTFAARNLACVVASASIGGCLDTFCICGEHRSVPTSSLYIYNVR